MIINRFISIVFVLFAMMNSYAQNCAENEITVTIQGRLEWDDETLMYLLDSSSDTLAIEEHYNPNPNDQPFEHSYCIPDGCYSVIHKSFTFSPDSSDIGNIGISLDGVDLIPFGTSYQNVPRIFSPNGLDCELCACPGNVNCDDTIDISDFLQFNSMFGNSCSNCTEDVDGNGVVDIDDFLIFNSSLGNSCP